MFDLRLDFAELSLVLDGKLIELRRDLHCRKSIFVSTNLSLFQMERGFVVVIIWELISFVAFVLNLTANSSDHWWVHIRDGGDNTFLRAGLWQVCFNMYRHRFDYYGKIYHGCWW